MSTYTIPNSYLNDRYWKGTLHLFMNNDRLKSVFTSKYFDFQDGTIKTTSLKRLSAPWSQSEKFMLNLALHLFNGRNKIDLNNMDYLDANNMELAMEAIKLRYY